MDNEVPQPTADAKWRCSGAVAVRWQCYQRRPGGHLPGAACQSIASRGVERPSDVCCRLFSPVVTVAVERVSATDKLHWRRHVFHLVHRRWASEVPIAVERQLHALPGAAVVCFLTTLPN